MASTASASAYAALRTPKAQRGEKKEETTFTVLASVESQEKPPIETSEKTPAAPPPVSLWGLFRFATPRDLVLLVLACVFACVNGALFPTMALVFGHAIAGFDPFDQAAVNRAAYEYLAIAVALFVTEFLMHSLFGDVAERLARLLREKTLRHLLHLDVAWYDAKSNEVLQLSSRITGDTVVIKNGMGSMLGEAINVTAQFVAGYVIGFVQSWDLALVMVCVTPISVKSMSYLLKLVRGLSQHTDQLYAEAGAIAEETLSSMRTVASLNGEKSAIERYDAKTKLVETDYIKLFRRAAFVQGIFTGSVWLMYAAGLWYGGWKVYQSELPPGTVFQAFFGIVIGTRSMGQISANVSAVAGAQASAAKLFQILDTEPVIDASKTSVGKIPETCRGQIVLRDVHFTYPSRTESRVLQGLDLVIQAGQTVAFVGPSGGGKSTIVALLERFYDPQHGAIELDGHNLRDLNVKWLRAQIGLVAQEPVLFASSIRDNIAAGSVSGVESVSEEDVIAAARLANAHGFIMAKPEQYNTLVGEKGSLLSGGQKQRIAIARAMLRRPKILVLDEATSALDNESERVVQAALNGLMQQQSQMTTLVIAHRLSTIRSADKIVVMANGRVAEQGTHAELMSINGGIYKAMLEAQTAERGSETDVEGDVENAEETAEAEQRSDATAIAEPNESDGPDQAEHEVLTLEPASSERTNEVAAGVEAESKFSVAEVMKLSAPEATYYAGGMLAAIVHGSALPCAALLISEVVAMMTEAYARFQATQDRHLLHELANSVRTYGQLCLLGACIVCCAHCSQVYFFRYMAAKLTSRLRKIHFESMCRQDIAFFDEAKNSTGALTADLKIQAAKVAFLSGDAQGKVMQAATTLVAAVLVAFLTGSWVLTLILLLILPFILIGEVIRNTQLKGTAKHTDELADAGVKASQALGNVRTVMAFGLEDGMCIDFSKTLDKPQEAGTKDAKINGLALGYSSFVVFATYALVFWYGGVLVDRGSITFKELIRTLMAIIMASQGIGFAASWAVESVNATEAGQKIFDVRDRLHDIDALADDRGSELSQVSGRLEFRDVEFRYPTRPEAKVLEHFNLTIEANQTVGFCGTSGGGKSTIVALVERFYDPLRGQVLLDGHDLKGLHVGWLRRQIGYVGQEPTLFIGTIAENIAFGLDETPKQEEIERVAVLANAHDFIRILPDGYNTQVGMNGGKLSGGQKQRIAIARALLRRPRILILDEATSALDSESEKIVQEALDQVVATKRCTTLVIAHRLSTLRHCDKICVVDQGRVAEEGTHEELLALSGTYAALLSAGRYEVEELPERVEEETE